MTSSIEIITTPTSDTPGTTVVLRTTTKHYFFGGLAEGTQRAVNQQGTKLLKAQDFFLTGRVEWSNTGGLIGMMLTLAGSCLESYAQLIRIHREAQSRGKSLPAPPKPHLNIYGPPNLRNTITACRRFIFRKGIPINATEYAEQYHSPQRDESGVILPTWQDSNIQVWVLSIRPTGQQQTAQAKTELEARRQYFDAHLNSFEEHQAPESESPEQRRARYDRIQSATMKHMFDSDWSFDTLVERHISEVEVPAAIFVRNPDTHGYEPYNGPMPGGSQPLPDITVFTRTPWPGARIIALPPTQPTLDCLSYIVRTHSCRGAFDVARAKALGVQPGRDFGKLAAGESVQNKDGEWIKPEQVLGPDRPGQGIAILSIPTVEYLERTLAREELSSPQIFSGVGAIIWTLGPGVLGHPALTNFISNMQKVQHFISSIDTSPDRISNDSVAGQATRLSQIDPVRYSTPVYDNVTVPQRSLYGGTPNEVPALPKDAIVADRGMSFVLMPKFITKAEAGPKLFNPDDVRKKTPPKVLALAENARKELLENAGTMYDWKQLLARPDTEVITLGTGSALPSKYRNVSATLVRVPGVGNYLFDAGESTLGQLTRMFPSEALVDVLKHLRMIWISHLHADHHLGTVSVIRAWHHVVYGDVHDDNLAPASASTTENEARSLAVISHNGMLQWLHEYSFIEDYGYNRILPLQISHYEKNEPSELSVLRSFGKVESAKSIIQRRDYERLFGFSDIQAVKVAHCYGAMAVSVTFPPSPDDGEKVKPLKISYSGDCRPSSRFAKMGQDTTVLIHEATFDDELLGDARAKKHSTTSEALGIGAKMNAKAVVLTHFSQRYQKIPVLQNVADGEQQNSLLDAAEVAEEVDDADEEEMDTTTQDQENTDIFPTPLPTISSSHEHEQIIKIRNKDMKVAIAFDYMRVKIGEIIALEKFNDALNQLLTEEEKEGVRDEGSVNANGKKNSGDEASGIMKKQKKGKPKRNN